MAKKNLSSAIFPPSHLNYIYSRLEIECTLDPLTISVSLMWYTSEAL